MVRSSVSCVTTCVCCARYWKICPAETMMAVETRKNRFDTPTSSSCSFAMTTPGTTYDSMMIVCVARTVFRGHTYSNPAPIITRLIPA